MSDISDEAIIRATANQIKKNLEVQMQPDDNYRLHHNADKAWFNGWHDMTEEDKPVVKYGIDMASDLEGEVPEPYLDQLCFMWSKHGADSFGWFIHGAAVFCGYSDEAKEELQWLREVRTNKMWMEVK